MLCGTVVRRVGAVIFRREPEPMAPADDEIPLPALPEFLAVHLQHIRPMRRVIGDDARPDLEGDHNLGVIIRQAQAVLPAAKF